MKKDRLFAQEKQQVSSFKFDREVAAVFDDMLRRSVPLYEESVTRQSQLAAQFYQPGTRIYDLGCSNGNLGLKICRSFKEKAFSMTAVDSSGPMIELYRQRLEQESLKGKVQLVCDFAENQVIENASVVIMNLTLQFISVDKREGFIKDIFQGLVSGGVLLLTEKIVEDNNRISELDQQFYTAFKRENGYSDLEIRQKREALNDVLMPESLKVHQKRLENAGFKTVDVWLKWFNFASMIAIKEQ